MPRSETLIAKFVCFAHRHPHAWLKRLDRNAVNLGHGKQMLVMEV